MIMVIAVSAVVGLLFGSFVNAAAWRLYVRVLRQAKSKELSKAEQQTLDSAGSKKSMSLLSGRSMCVHCHHELVPRDLVPVVSWVSLKGRCRYCAQPISWQYPFVEVLTTVLFVISVAVWDFTMPLAGVQLAVWLVTLVGLLVLAVIDWKWGLLPFSVTVPLVTLHVVMLVVLALSGESVISEVLAVGLFGGGFVVLYAISRGAWLGFGDIPLIVLMGLILGLPGTALGLFIGSSVGSLYGLVVMLRRKDKKSIKIAFGPLLVAGLYIANLWGDWLIDSYVYLLT